MQKRWAEIPLTTPELIPELQASLQINEVLARLLVLRGVHNYDKARDFFRPNIHHLHDPFLMQDMEQAIERIEQAIAQQEKILVFGDYDVDGTTAVALVYRFFSKYYDQLEYYIPDRYL